MWCQDLLQDLDVPAHREQLFIGDGLRHSPRQRSRGEGLQQQDTPLVRWGRGPYLPSELGPEPSPQGSSRILSVPAWTFLFAVLRSEVLRHSPPIGLGPLQQLRLDSFLCLS